MSLILPRGQSIRQATHDAFLALSQSAQGSAGSLPSSQESHSHLLSPAQQTDEIERLQIWAAEHEVQSGNLDHKLRDCRPLRDLVLSLLARLANTTTRTEETKSSGAEDDSHDASTIKSVSLQQNQPLSPLQQLLEEDTSDGSSSFSADTGHTDLPSLPDSPAERVHSIITHLFELGQSLEDPAPHDKFERAAHPDAAQQDINHVRARFPKANPDLVDRLGRANWDRRQSLSNWRKLHEEAVQTLQNADTKDFASQSSELSSSESGSDVGGTDQSEDPPSPSLMGGSMSPGVGPAAVTSPGSTSSADSRSYFQFSHKETISTTPTETFDSTDVGRRPSAPQAIPPAMTRPIVPMPPKPVGGSTDHSFLCPFCFHTIKNISNSQWRKHVFVDLEPYMCTYADCTLSGKTFDKKATWWDHETLYHRVKHIWECKPCAQDLKQSMFETAESFEEHFKMQHAVIAPQLYHFRDLCQKNVGKERPSAVCPLCQEDILRINPGAWKHFEHSVRDHVAGHLEQLAFFVALPAEQRTTVMADDDGSEFQDDSDSEFGLQSEIRSIVSKDTHLSRKDIHLTNVRNFLADQRRVKNSREATPPPDASANKSQPFGTLEFPIRIQCPPLNEHFYCRQNLLDRVQESLRTPGSISILHGVGGIGKTLAAVEYLYTYKDDYDAIFWLQADTAPGLAESFCHMAVTLELVKSTEDHHFVIGKGRDWLQETDRRWIMVFDNVIQWSHISTYMPNFLKDTRGSVLITTQNGDLLDKASNVSKIRLEPLTSQAGAEMLLSYLGRDVQKDPERYLAKEISSFVGGLPVAIGHIAGYVSFSQVNLEELIEMFREWRRSSGVATTEEDDLPAALREASVSYEEMLSMVREVALRELFPDAREVLNILAFLNCGSVHEDVIWGIHDDPSIRWLDGRERVKKRRIKESLTKRRLIFENDSCFSMHRSLQRGIRDKLARDKNKQQYIFDQAVALIREAFPVSNPLQQPTPDKWLECQRLLPHLHALHDVYHGAKGDIVGSLDFAQLLHDASLDQCERGNTDEGLLLLHTAEQVLEAASGPSADGTLRMKADINALIAMMYDDIGIEKRAEALRRREKALEIRRKLFAETKGQNRRDEIMVYASEMEYAMSQLHYHRYRQAEPIIEKCLAKYKEWGTEEEIPFEYSKYYNKIGIVRMYQGRFDEAISLSAHGVELISRTGYRVFTSRFKFDMACIILQRRDPVRALKVHKEIYEERLEMLGTTNRLTLDSMYAIGAIYELQGNLDEAESWFNAILSQRRTVTSWPQVAFARTQLQMAKVLLARGNPEDTDRAEELHDKAIAVLQSTLPMDMPPELEGVTDEGILFDHLLPITPGGSRFAGIGLLKYFMRKGEEGQSTT